MDPSGRWLSRWQRQMERYEIPWLRSPSPHHPHPNAHALRQFAHSRQRSRQLEGPYGLPHTDLFADFCRQVISEYQLTEGVRAASVERIRLPQVGSGPMELALSDGTTMAAPIRAVSAPNTSRPFMPNPCMRRRQRQVLEARDGASITPETAAQLRLAQRAGALQLDEHCEVRSAQWCSDQWTVRCPESVRWARGRPAHLPGCDQTLSGSTQQRNAPASA